MVSRTGDEVATSNQEKAPEAASGAGKKPKRKSRTILTVGIVIVIVIVLLAVVLQGSGNSTPKTTFAIVFHDVAVEPNSTTAEGFNVTVYFKVNNTGSAIGNVTVVYKVISGRYTWAGAQIFKDVAPGESLYSYRKHIPVEGDVNGDWVYQVFLSGTIMPPRYTPP